MLVLGLPCLVAGSLCYFIPETRNKELPQNMKDTIKNDVNDILNNDNIEEFIKNETEIDNEKPIIKTKTLKVRMGRASLEMEVLCEMNFGLRKHR